MTIKTKPLIAVVCIGDFGKRLLENLRLENLSGVSRYLHLDRHHTISTAIAEDIEATDATDGYVTTHKLAEVFTQLDAVLVIDLFSPNPEGNWLATKVAALAEGLGATPVKVLTHRMSIPALLTKLKEKLSLDDDELMQFFQSTHDECGLLSKFELDKHCRGVFIKS
jgi:hypothetical protein